MWIRPPTQLQLALQRGCWSAMGYSPHDEQIVAHEDNSPIKLIAGGVGGGKSLFTAAELAKYLGIVNGLIWIVGPSYELADPEFRYLLDACREMEIVDEAYTSERYQGSQRFRLIEAVGGCEVRTKSATNEQALAGRRPHALAMVEAAQQEHSMLNKVLERGTENDAPIVLSGTFEMGRYWYQMLWERWQGENEEYGKSFSLPTWSNLNKYPGGRDDPKIKRVEGTMPDELFNERYGGIPSKPSGVVFKTFARRDHVRPLEQLFDPALPVMLAADPATHCYPILFVQVQKDGKTVHILDELYPKGVIGQQVIPDVVAREIPLAVRKAVYGKDYQSSPATWWEHSCGSGVMDIAGTRRQGANKSQVEVWQEELTRLKAHPISWSWRDIRDVRLWYNAIHLRLWHVTKDEAEKKGIEERPPMLFFASHLSDIIDADGSANGVIGEMLTHRWPEENEHGNEASRPLKRNEDALSAVGYFLYKTFGPVEQKRKRGGVKRTPYYHAGTRGAVRDSNRRTGSGTRLPVGTRDGRLAALF